MLPCFAVLGSANEKGEKCCSPTHTRSHPDVRQNFQVLVKINGQWLGTFQRYLPPTTPSVHLYLSFMDLRFTANEMK